MTEPLPTVIASGDHRRALEALRDKLAEELDSSTGRDAATIAKELRAVLDMLSKLPATAEVSQVDQLAARRAARRANTAAS